MNNHHNCGFFFFFFFLVMPLLFILMVSYENTIFNYKYIMFFWMEVFDYMVYKLPKIIHKTWLFLSYMLPYIYSIINFKSNWIFMSSVYVAYLMYSIMFLGLILISKSGMHMKIIFIFYTIFIFIFFLPLYFMVSSQLHPKYFFIKYTFFKIKDTMWEYTVALDNSCVAYLVGISALFMFMALISLVVISFGVKFFYLNLFFLEVLMISTVLMSNRYFFFLLLICVLLLMFFMLFGIVKNKIWSYSKDKLYFYILVALIYALLFMFLMYVFYVSSRMSM